MSLTSSTQNKTIIVNPYSGDYRIDVLIPSATARWNNGKNVGTAVEVTFSFMTSAPTYGEDSDKKNFSVFTESQKAAARKILSEVSQQIGITFIEVSETTDSFGVMRFGNNSQGTVSAGYASYPDTLDTRAAGDLYINNDDAVNLENVVAGTNAYSTLVHEIGHALGLKHPGNYDAGSTPSTTPDNFLATAEDNEINTIMSYTQAPQKQDRDFFAKYDLLALKYLYGGKAYNAIDTQYSYTDAVGQLLKLINDTGGIDTINVFSLSIGAMIDLTPGSNSSIGLLASGEASINNVAIAYDALIENVIGSNFADTIKGNHLNNRIDGGKGSDTIDGGLGFDTLIIRENRVDFNIQKIETQIVFHNKLSGEKISFMNVERVILNDSAFAYDFAGTAGQAYRLYQAAFDRKPDLAGLGYWISDMDKGADLTTVAAGFMQSAEFQTLYGINPNNTTLITNFYKNVLHRTPDQAGFDYWFKQLDNKEITAAGALASFTESAENQAQVAEAILVGIEYQVWQST